MILHKLGLSDSERVYARKTSVVEVSFKEASEFLEVNHIQGSVSGSSYLALKAGEKTVAVSVWKKTGESLYLERYATDCVVIGGLGKLIRFVESSSLFNDWVEIVTFAAHDVSDGSLYHRLGFEADRELKPDYMYIVDGQRVHKFNYRLARFKNDDSLLYEEGHTEQELAVKNGLLRIWDCGKTRFIKKNVIH